MTLPSTTAVAPAAWPTSAVVVCVPPVPVTVPVVPPTVPMTVLVVSVIVPVTPPSCAWASPAQPSAAATAAQPAADHHRMQRIVVSFPFRPPRMRREEGKLSTRCDVASKRPCAGGTMT
jgi:hypothetical protein